MTLHAIPPEEQILKLNRYLIDNAGQLPSPVITVGGQAVMYWYLTYLHLYPDQPDVTSITSIDVDYVTRIRRSYLGRLIFWLRNISDISNMLTPDRAECPRHL